MSGETRREWTDLGLRHRRTWILADKSNNETPRWIARLKAVSLSLKVLPSFQLQNLSRGNLFAARTWNAFHRIYDWDCRWAGEYNYNCIYDDKPLQGWWPWPREEGTYMGFSGPAMELDGPGELAGEPLASRCQFHASHEPDQQPSCVIL
jgi:hypothetical protein